MGLRLLFRNVLKSFSRKKFQLLAVAVIIFMSSFLYTAMFMTTSSMEKKLGEYETVYNIEDFSIEISDYLTEDEIFGLDPQILSTNFNYTLTQLKYIDEESYRKLIGERVSLIEETYESDYRLMLREGKDLVFGDYSFRAYYHSDDINRTFLEEGRMPVNGNEVCLNKTFLKNHDYQIGDYIKLGDGEYLISGSILFVDYSLALINDQMLFDMENSGVALFTDDELDRLRGQDIRYLSGLCADKELFKAEVIDEFDDDPLDFVLMMTMTENQIRSGAIIEEIRGGQLMTLGLAIIISLLAVLTVAIITYKMISGERKQIGLMKAMGYQNNEITIPYIVLLTIVSLPMLVLGYVSGVYGADGLKDMFLRIYMLPDAVIETEISVLLVSILVPFVFIIGLSYLVIRRNLTKPALSLLKYSNKTKASRLNRLTNRLLRNARATTRFKYSYLTQSPGKLMVFFIGIFSASSLFVMSVMFIGFSERTVDDFFNSKAYLYEGIVDFSRELPELQDGEEIYLDGQVYLDDELISVKGLESDNHLYKIYRRDKDITGLLDEGIVINKSLAISEDIEKGDILNLHFRGEDREYEVMGVSDESSDRIIYMSRAELADIYGDEDLYSGVYSLNQISDEYKLVIEKQDILDLSESMNGFVNLAIGILLAISMLISVLILYILTTLSVEDNFYSISLLKVMGYTEKEVNRMILNSYLVYSVVAYLIALPLTIIGLDWMMAYFTEYYGMYLSFEIDPLKALAGVVLIVLVYYLGSIQAGREIKSISLQQVLKEYQE